MLRRYKHTPSKSGFHWQMPLGADPRTWSPKKGNSGRHKTMYAVMSRSTGKK